MDTTERTTRIHEATNLELLRDMVLVAKELLRRDLDVDEVTQLVRLNHGLDELTTYHAARSIATQISEAGIESFRVHRSD